MSDALVTSRRQDGISILTLNRPARHNALVPELLSALLSALKEDTCLESAAVVLCAEGSSFSTGGDLLGFARHSGSIQAYAHELVGLLNEAIISLYSHPVPVVCAVQGQVTGGALGLLLAADRVVINRDAKITPWYGEIGFSPDGGWTALLPQVIGRQAAAHWLMTNANHDAGTCLALGLVHQVTDRDCKDAALAWARRVAKMHPESIHQARRLLNMNTQEIARNLEAERTAFVAQVQTEQALNGIKRFLRRKDHE